MAPSDKHHLFARGQLQKDVDGGAEQFPGQGPSSIGTGNNKGIIVGHTWTITNNLINDVRYGYIRQGGSSTGVGKGDYVNFRFLDYAHLADPHHHLQRSGQQHRR